jgi:hypothetical protein
MIEHDNRYLLPGSSQSADIGAGEPSAWAPKAKGQLQISALFQPLSKFLLTPEQIFLSSLKYEKT